MDGLGLFLGLSYDKHCANTRVLFADMHVFLFLLSKCLAVEWLNLWWQIFRLLDKLSRAGNVAWGPALTQHV